MSYYKPSGKFNPVLTALGVSIGVLLTIALAYLYVQLGSWVSFIILKFCLLAITIYGTLEITKLSNWIARSRNQFITYFSAFVFSFVLLYFSWFFFVVIELEQDFVTTFSELWNYVELLFAAQEYEVSTPISWFTDTNGARVSNWETYLVLGGESLLLILGSILALKIDHFDTMIFCESCNNWSKNTKTIHKKCDVAFTTAQLEQMIDNGDISPLLSLTDVNIDNKILFEIYEVKLYGCKNCNENNYIKISRVNTKLSSKNANKSEVLLNYYKIENNELLAELKNSGGNA